jgi:hypothetical protein
MNSISDYYKKQYELVLESRKVLLDYCKTVSAPDFLNANSSFGRGGSIRNLWFISQTRTNFGLLIMH